MINPNDVQINKLKLGMLLKSIRENRDVSQRDAAAGIGYSNATFVCNVEKGANNMPMDKVYPFASAYAESGDTDILALAIIRLAQPSAWATCFRAFSTGFEVGDSKKLEQEVDKWIKTKCKQFKINL